MAFQISDFDDLLRLLQEHPEWQTQLRNALLSDDFLALPNIVRQLGDRMDQLATGMVKRFGLLDQQFEQIDEHLLSLDNVIADLQEWRLRDRYEKNGAVYFGKLLRKARVISKEILADRLSEILDEQDFTQALLIDVVVKGKLKVGADSFREIYLAFEVSKTINQADIERAIERARLISRVGIATIPVTGGEFIHDDTFRLASDSRVVVHCGGQISFWQSALAQHGNLN